MSMNGGGVRAVGGVTDQVLGRECIACLYADHVAVLVGYACTLVGNRAAAEDLVQQVFARLLRGDIAIRERPLAYLCQAVRYAALNDRRTRFREVGLDEPASWLQAPRGLEEAGLAIEAALRRLPEEQREVVVLKIWGQLTFQEIGMALETPANTVASRYRYGLAKLRDILKPLGVV